MIFITYYFGSGYGVAGKRSAYLHKMLKTKITIRVIEKNSFKGWESNKFIWLLKTLCILLKKKEMVVYISCGPFWHLPMIALVCLLKKHKVYVDFRDGWSINIRTGYGQENSRFCFLKYHIVLTLERFLYSISERFIVCTKGMAKEYRKIFGDDKKIMLIRNGHEIEGEKLKCICGNMNKHQEMYKVVCAGKFLHDMPNGKSKIMSLYKRIKKEKKYFKIYFIGTDEDTEKELSAIENIIFCERLPYDELINFIADSDLVLTAIRNEDFDYGTKIFDYIALGLPVYDWFNHDKDFYKEFNQFLVEGLDECKKINYDISGKYSRKEAFKSLVDVMVKGMRNKE